MASPKMEREIQYPTISLDKVDSHDPRKSKYYEHIKKYLFAEPLAPSQRQAARNANAKKFLTTKRGRLTIVNGSTGAGKTTGFTNMFTSNTEDNGLLVLPSNANVEDAYNSALGIYKAQHPDCKDPLLEMPCNIMKITAENKNGWRKELERNIAQRDRDNSNLIIVNASFFFSTMSYWFENDYQIMYDEPDNKDNSIVNPTALLLCYMLKMHTQRYDIKSCKSKNKRQLDKMMEEFDNLRQLYIEAGNSYLADPSDHEFRHHINALKRKMRPFTGKIFLSSATLPDWLVRGIEHMELEYDVIEMIKPSNPRLGIYLSHFDRALEECIKEGSVTPLFTPLIEAVVKRLQFLRDNEKEFAQGIDKEDIDLQLRSYRKILIPMPGFTEVHNLSLKMESAVSCIGFNCKVITPHNRYRDHDSTAYKVEIVPYSEMQGLNHVAASGFITPFWRIATQTGNRKTLHIDWVDRTQVVQATGRIGRLSACNIMFVGSETTFNRLEAKNLFCQEGLKNTVMGLVSHDLHDIQLDRLNHLFISSAGASLRQQMVSLLGDGFIEILEDEHYALTRNGRIYNLFHDMYPIYMEIEDFLRKEKALTQNTMFKMLLWMQLYVNLTNGKNTLFKFPEDQGIRKSMRESKLHISEETGIMMDSHYAFLWAIVEFIHGTMMSDRYEGKMDELYKFKTYAYTYNTHTPIGIFANRAHLDTKTLRLCCASALNNLYALNSRHIIEYPEEHLDSNFSFDDFTMHKSLQDLANNKIQIATKVDSKDNVSIYVGNDGFKYMVHNDLVDSTGSGQLVGIVESLVKPDMLDKKTALATVTIPVRILSKAGNMMDMLMEYLDDSLVAAINEWLRNPDLSCPFTFVDESDMMEIVFMSMLGIEIKITQVNSLAYSVLLSMFNMKEAQKTLDDESRRELYDFFSRMFMEHVRENLSGGGATQLSEVQLPHLSGEILGDIGIALKINKSKTSLFTPYVLRPPQKSGKKELHASQFKPGKCGNCSKFQRLYCHTRPESAAVIQERRDRYDAQFEMTRPSDEEYRNVVIEPRPCCQICRRTDTPSNKVSFVLVNQQSKTGNNDDIKSLAQNSILMVYHTDCLKQRRRDPDFGMDCPHTGGLMYDIGLNGIEMIKTPEDTIHDIKKVKMTVDERTTHVRQMMMSNVTHINETLNINLTDDDFEQMPPDDLHAYHENYTEKMEQIKVEREAEKKRQQREAAQKKRREEQELRKRQRALDKANAERKAAKKENAKAPSSQKKGKGRGRK